MRHLLNNPNTILETGSDGGKIESGGSFAWLVLTNGLKPMWRCAGPVDGREQCQRSLRSELTAIASMGLILEEFCKFNRFKKIQCKIKVYVDNLQAIKHLNNIQNGIESQQYEANANSLNIIANCPMVLAKIKPSHVKAHQDDKKHPSELNYAAQINILCNQLNSMLWGPMQPQHTPKRPASIPIEITCQGKVINFHYTKRLHEEIGAGYHQDYVCEKFKWTQQTYAHIDWTAIEKVAKNVKIQQLATLSKLAHNWPLRQRRQLHVTTKEAKAIAEHRH